MKIRKYLKISYINTAQDFGKSVTVSHQFITKPDVLVSNLSFSHIREINNGVGALLSGKG